MAGFHVIAGPDDRIVHPDIRRIGFSDLTDALRRGLDDFMAQPSHIMFIVIIYPLVGVFLAAWTSGNNALPLLFPLMSGFALIGPFAAIGLYEISRRREAGLDTSWKHALDVRHSPAIPAIMAVGFFLFAVFIAWLLCAQGLYNSLYSAAEPTSVVTFFTQVLTTPQGWQLIIVGGLIGFIFAALVLCTTVIAFPLLLDRDVGAYEAIATSFRAVAANPVMMATWGLIVALLLAIGSLPVFAGLIIVIPVLGHATWHLYRKVIEPPRA